MSHERCFGNSLVTIQSFKISTHLQQGEIQMTDRDYEQLETNDTLMENIYG